MDWKRTVLIPNNLLPETGTAAGQISATVNGRSRVLRSGATLAALVEQLGLQPDRLAIELDRRIVKPAEWAGTAIPNGAQIEIVHFVGGG